MKYKTRKEEAIRKLTSANANLEKVEAILNEININLVPLEEKSAKARKYLDIKEKLKVLDINIFLDDVKENAEKIAEFDSQISILNDDLKKEEEVALELEKAKLNLKERLDEISLKIEENQAKYYESQSLIEKSKSKKEMTLSNIENNNQQIARLDEEVNQDTEKINLLKEELSVKDKKKETLLLNKEKFVKELEEKQNSLDEIMKNVSHEEEKIENIKREIEALEEEIDEINIENSSRESKIEEYEKQLADIIRNSSSHNLEIDKLSLDKDGILADINNRSLTFEKVQSEEGKIEESIKNILKEKEDYITKLDSINSECMTKNSRLSYLKHLKEENEGYLKSVKEACSYAKKENMDGVYGTVADVISTDEKYEKAIEIALGGFLQNIIVEKDTDAKKIIEYLKENSLGRATFLPLNTIKKVDKDNFDKLKKFEGFIGSAIELVSVDKKYIDVINLALNRCVIVDNLDNANKLYKESKDKVKLVTLSGEVIQPIGSITGGATSSKNLGLLGREDKIKKLEKEIAELEESKKINEEKLNEVTENLDKLETEKSKFTKEKEDINLNLAVLNEKLEAIKRDEIKLEQRKNTYLENKENLENQLKNLKEDIEISNKKENENTLKIDEKKKIVEEYARFNKESQSELDGLNEDIVNLKISLASFDESTLSIDEMKEKLENDIKNFEEAIEKKSAKKREYMLEILSFNNEIEEIEKSSVDLKKFEEEYSSVSNQLKESKKDISEKLDTLEVKMLEGVNRNVKIKDEISKLENKKVKFEFEMDNIKNRMWDEYELTINSSKEYAASAPKVENISKAKKDAEGYRNEIKALGDVDVSSIEEYTSVKARHDFIISQKEDLDETKNKLENLISNITTMMKDQFISGFKLINSNFKDTFTKLFGGGKANLKLTDESDVLETGIEIEVQPPGKKLQSMSLLSGGEKSLTAIALLFAILKIKAPPFCILDEIEAALDDVNVSRFADYIKMYSDNTQFIVITHRKGTMEAARTVYGVTMEEYGVSKLVSMKLK